MPYNATYAQTIREERNKKIDELIETIIKRSEEAALAGLKEEFPHLYPPDQQANDPKNKAIRRGMEEAAITLVAAGRNLIDLQITAACIGVIGDIEACPPFKNKEALIDVLSDSVVNQFVAAKEMGAEKLKEMIALTNAHTIQSLTINQITMNLVMIAAVKESLREESRLIDIHIITARNSQENLAWWEELFGASGKIQKGIDDLQEAQLRLGQMFWLLNDEAKKLEGLKKDFEAEKIKPADIGRLMNEALVTVGKIKAYGDGLLSILDRPTLAWLVEQANKRNPQKPIDLNVLKKSVKDRLEPITKAEEESKKKETLENMQKLKDSLGLPNIKPAIPLENRLHELLLDAPKKPASGKPTGTMTGVDGDPFVSDPVTSAASNPPAAVPPKDAIPIGSYTPLINPNGIIVGYELHPVGRPGQVFMIIDIKDALTFNSIKNKIEGSSLYLYDIGRTDPKTGKPIKKIGEYIPPEKRAEAQNGTIK